MYEFSSSGLLHRILRLAFWMAHLPFLFAVAWVMGLFITQPIFIFTLIPFVIFLIWRTRRNGPFHLHRRVAVFCALEAALFYFLPGPQAEAWQPDTARAAAISLKGETLHIANIRDFIHRTERDADIRYLEEEFDFNTLTDVYLVQTFHDADSCNIMLSFAFNDGRYLAFSPEIRIAKGDEYNEVRAYYKDYGLIYIFGTEEDLLLQRTTIRKEAMQLYPLKATAKQAGHMLLACAALAQAAEAGHKAYNPLLQDYAHELLGVLRILCPELPKAGVSTRDIPRMLYEHRLLKTPILTDWATVRNTFTVRPNLQYESREDYSDAIRRAINLPTRSVIPQRNIQELRLHEADLPHQEVTKPTPQPSVASLISATDIPELDARLEDDRLRDEAKRREEEETAATEAELEETAKTNQETEGEEEESLAETARKLNEQKSLLPAGPTAGSAILEAGARLDADNRKEEEENEEEEGKMEKRPDFDELFFGKRESGIKIIEKEKPKAEAHPLDPVKRRRKKTPFDEEEKPKQQKPQEEDPFTPKAPIKI